MAESDNWETASWDGLRHQQRRDFKLLPLREKFRIVEQMGEVSAFFRMRRIARGLPVDDTYTDPPPNS